jgi:hypothetical protein
LLVQYSIQYISNVIVYICMIVRRTLTGTLDVSPESTDAFGSCRYLEEIYIVSASTIDSVLIYDDILILSVLCFTHS